MALFTVTVGTDEDDGNTAPDDLSLREAIDLANAAPGPDVIEIDQRQTGSILRLTLGELQITDSVTIDGDLDDDGVPDVTITGDAADDDPAGRNGITDMAAAAPGDVDDNSRIFHLDSPTESLTLIGLTLTGGYTSGNSSPANTLNSGGAVRALGPLTIIDSTLAGNGTGGAYSRGGAVISEGGFLLQDSTVDGNVTMGLAAYGGGVYASDGIDVVASTISNNRTNGLFADGGGLHGTGELSIVGSLVTGNTTTGLNSDGGGVATRIDVGGIGAPTLRIANSTIEGNFTQSGFGTGGGISSQGDLIVVNSTLAGNYTLGGTSNGGGLLLAGEGLLVNATIAGNRTTASDSSGGGIWSFSNLSVVNSTVTGNAAPTSTGGGIYAFDNSLIVGNSIIAGNQAATSNDLFGDEATLDIDFFGGNILGSLIGGNGAATDFGTLTFVNGSDAAVLGGIFDQIAANPDTGIETGVLAQNGGPVATIALQDLADNPALDAGDANLLTGLDEGDLGADLNGDGDMADFLATIANMPFDARGPGFLRDVDLPGPGGSPDLGAFEVQQLNAAPVAGQDDLATEQFVPLFAIDVLANDSDPDGDPLSLTGDVTVPAGGRAFVNEDGTIAYASRPDFTGPDSFDYTVTDDDGATQTGTVFVDVTAGANREICARIVAYLYEATFDRFPDLPGVNFWIDAVFGELPDQAVPFTKAEIAQFFLDSPEFAATFGDVDSLSDQELIEQLFLNTLDRPGDQAGVDFWVGVLADPEFTRAEMLVAFAQSPENQLGSPGIVTLEEVSPSEWEFVGLA